MRRSVTVGLFACLATFGSHGLAAPPAPGAQQLEREARRAKTWRYSWTAINGGLTVGAFALVPLVAREDRPDFVVSGVGSAITTFCTWIWPLRVEGAAAELDALPPAERERHLRRLLSESAADERDRVGWPWHVANIGLAAAGGAVIAFGYRHYLSGALTAAAGGALGEIQLFTQPTGLGADGVAGRATAPRLAIAPKFAAMAGGWAIGLVGRF